MSSVAWCGGECFDVSCDVDAQSWDEWERAWDMARDADKQAGRPYDRHRYADAASNARKAFLRSHARGE